MPIFHQSLSERGSDAVNRCELHCHLDGSVRLNTLANMAAAARLTLVAPIERLAVAPEDVGDLPSFLTYIDIALDVLQTPDALRRTAAELVADWAADGVDYGEARFAPQLHTRADMAIDDAIIAVADGLAEGTRAHGVGSALIVCCLRQQAPEISLMVADAAARLRHVVAGLDLAGDERVLGARHVEAFNLAHSQGIPVTVHAGEAVGPESVWEALDVLGACRIGHGVRSVEEAALLDRLRRDQIVLETCPRSNVLTRAVPALAAHPVARFLNEDIRATVNTDARTTAATTLTAELDSLAREFGWSDDEPELLCRNAAKGAFGPLLPTWPKVS